MAETETIMIGIQFPAFYSTTPVNYCFENAFFQQGRINHCASFRMVWRMIYITNANAIINI